VRLPFFYGWIIVAITMVAGILAAGVSNITMAVVLKPISDDLGWSRLLTAAAIMMGGLLGGNLSPLFGPFADRLGPRFLLPLGGALVGLLAFGVSRSTEPWQFYATFVPARVNGISPLRHDIFHDGHQLVLCQTSARDGSGDDGAAARVRRSFHWSISSSSLIMDGAAHFWRSELCSG